MNRLILKERAKNVLKTNYWIAFIASLIVSVLSGTISSYFGSSSSAINILIDNNSTKGVFDQIGFMANEQNIFVIFAAFLGSILVFAMLCLIICYSIFVISPLSVGNATFFLELRKNETTLHNLFSVFSKERYKNAMITMLMRNLFIFLWSLLLIIPGIYYSYVYYLVPYIVAENPSINYKKALELSKKITDGYKFEIFIMELSFIGWYLLGSLVVIGGLFVNPYKESSFAEMYIDLRDNAIEQGKISYNEIVLP